MARITDHTVFPPLTPSSVSVPTPRLPSSTIEIAVGEAILRAELAIPQDAVGLVAILHGAAEGYESPSPESLLDLLHDAGLATLRTDLFTADETHGDHANGMPFFDIQLLVDRLVGMMSALHARADTRGLPLGLVADRAVATAALYAAAEYPEQIGAVVTRSARPDLAGPFFPQLTAPTLLIVGARDPETRQINEAAFQQLAGPRSLEIIPEATHQFIEPVARDHAAALTRTWLMRHLCRPARLARPLPVS